MFLIVYLFINLFKFNFFGKNKKRNEKTQTFIDGHYIGLEYKLDQTTLDLDLDLVGPVNHIVMVVACWRWRYRWR